MSVVVSVLLDSPPFALWGNETAARYAMSSEFMLGTLTDAPEKGSNR